LVLETLKVDLAERSYDIVFGDGIISKLGPLCRDLALGENAIVITNSTIEGYYFEPARKSLADAGYTVHKLLLPDGEAYKNSETLQSIYEALIDAGLDRGAFIVALGGGVIGDIAGFAAATYLRGISFVQVPTTLLAQVDSSVGGKTGINHVKGKNLIGAFYQPKLVCVDVQTLATLPEREYLSGLAEVVKYGIVADAEFFEYIYSNSAKLLARDKDCLLTIEKRSCAIKAAIVMQDERESGVRAVLNYGHTIGHAIENLSGYKNYLHGEAVAIGMAQAAKIAEVLGYSTKAATGRIVYLLESLQLPVELPVYSVEAFSEAILRDKKVKDGHITFVLNNGIGNYSFVKISDLHGVLKKCGIGE
jgi:3-dehydroquinate synthase